MAEGDIKKLDLVYEDIRILRQLMVDEVLQTTTHMSVAHYRLVEDMLQTLLMYGKINKIDIKKAIKKPRTDS